MKKEQISKMPHAIEAENAIIGAILGETTAFSIARTFVSADSFYEPKNRLVFAACEALFAENRPIELIAISNALRSKKSGVQTELDIVGIDVMVDMMENISSSANIEFHCRIVIEMWMRRLLAGVSTTNAKRAFDYTYDVFEIMSKSLSEISKITEKLAGKKSKSFAELAYDTIINLESPEQGENDFIPTGIYNMDQQVKMKAGDLVIIAARPGMGKTSLIVTILVNLGKKGRRGLFFSLEMPAEQIIQKALACDSDVPYWKIRERKCDSFEKDMLYESYGNIKGITTMINDSSNLTIEEIKALSIAENAKEPIEFVIIDFLQITKPSAGGTRDQEIGHITRNAKSIAKELKVPVIYLSQLSREVEKRADKRPQLSDLRDSGNIEQDADTVILMFRPEYYRIEIDENNESTKDMCEIDYAKNRHGGTGMVKVGCRMETGKFW